VTIRPYDSSLDLRFVRSGWAASQRMTRDIPLIPHAMWREDFWHPVVEFHLTRPAVRTLISVGDEDMQRGFISYEPPRVDAGLQMPAYVLYAYVAQPYRKQGDARALFEAAGIDPLSAFAYACRTKASWMLRKKVPHAVYDPMRARFAQKETT
jgi:GNAT superfamily N-acetyltransferase